MGNLRYTGRYNARCPSCHHVTSYRSEQQSTKWTNLVDCGGGLHHVDDIVYELFVALEHLADKELTSIFQARGKVLKI